MKYFFLISLFLSTTGFGQDYLKEYIPKEKVYKVEIDISLFDENDFDENNMSAYTAPAKRTLLVDQDGYLLYQNRESENFASCTIMDKAEEKPTWRYYTHGDETWTYKEYMEDGVLVLESLDYNGLTKERLSFKSSELEIWTSDSTEYLRKFDEYGNVIYVQQIEKGDTIFKKFVEILDYDSKGNWIKRKVTGIQSQGHYTKLIEERKIWYFNDQEYEQYYSINIDSVTLDDRVFTYEDFLRDYYEEDIVYFDESKGFGSPAIFLRQYFQTRFFNSEYYFQFPIRKEYPEDEVFYPPNQLFNKLHCSLVKFGDDYGYVGWMDSDNWRKKPLFPPNYYDTTTVLQKTNDKVMIGNHECVEYKADFSGGSLIMYVSEQYPFINLWEVPFELPGMLIKYVVLKSDGLRLSVTCNVSAVDYPVYYLEFLNEAKEKYGFEFGHVKAK